MTIRPLTSISIAVPVFNESDVLPTLVDRLTATLATLEIPSQQIVMVDDGSTDDTADQLRRLVGKDPRFEAILLSRNFGHQAALSAALDRVTGDVTVVMDADLQDDPDLIPAMLEKYREGYDVVYAVRRTRKENVLRRTTYRVFYRVLSKVSNVALPVDAGDFGLMSKRVVKAICASPERQRYLRGLRAWVGFRQYGLEVDRLRRQAGESKYSTAKLMALALNGIFAFSLIPLRMATLLGALAVTVAAAWAAFVFYAKLFLDQSPQGFSSLVITVVFRSGANLFFLGVIGEYVGRTYEESKGRPLYVISEILVGRSRPLRND
jgi:dolichol-phosphate mannosyltransferase